MRLLLSFFMLCISAVVLAQQDTNPTGPYEVFIHVEKKWLVLPVKNGAPKRNLELWVDGKDERFFDIELADNEPADWLAYIEIGQWKGKNIELRVDKLSKGSSTFHPVQQTDADDGNGNVYHEQLRGQFHFSPKRGWTNDPNGLVYYNGEYHLFFQHNPYGRGWGNMTWGHAVSKDLVHWQELGDVLHPDHFGPMFSGGAVVDEKNTSGLGKDGKPAMVVFYTAARAWAQGMAWSTDGRTFTKSALPVVPRIGKDNRDPKVIWHEPTQKWVMLFWVPRAEEQHTIQILTSPDLTNWTPVSFVEGGKGNDRFLYECPEFYELPVDGNATEKKWVLIAANNEYTIGRFDGIIFTPEERRIKGQYGRGYYASQTFSNEPKGRRVEIGWWQTATDKEGMCFNQSMSLPLEVKLTRTKEGIRIARFPVQELAQLREQPQSFRNIRLKPGGPNPLKGINETLAELQVVLSPGKATEVNLDIRGLSVSYNVQQQHITIDGVTAPLPLKNGQLAFTLFIDRTGVELLSADGLVYMPVNKNLDEGNRTFSVMANGGIAKIQSINIYRLKSIWP